jgi:putative ABC transport system permease protein
VVLLGPASAYAAIAIVNAVLIGVSQRVPQMRTARLLGATPAQVRRALAWEAGLVGGAALVAGAATTLLVGWLIAQAIMRDTGAATLTVPWLELAGVVGSCGVLVLAAAGAGALAAAPTRPMDC